MALTPEQIKAGLKTLKPTQITEQKAPVIMPSTTTPTTNIMPKVTQVQPLSPKQNIMSPSLQVQSGVQPEKDYKALATPEEKAKVIKMLQAGYPEATVREGFRQAIDRRLEQENNARGQEPKKYVMTPEMFQAEQNKGLKDIAGGLISSATSVGESVTSLLDKPAQALARAIAPSQGVSQEQVTSNIQSVQERENTPIGARITGGDPESIGYKGGKLAGDIAQTAMVGGLASKIPAVAGTVSKLGALGNAGKIAVGALEGAGGQAVYSGIADKRLPTAGELALGAGVGGAIPALGIAYKGAKKVLPKIADKADDAANKMLTNMNRITKGEQEKFAVQQGKTVGEWMNSKGLVSGGDESIEALAKGFKASKDKADEGLSLIKGEYKNDYLSTMAREASEFADNTLSPQASKMKELADKADNIGLTMPETNEVKRFFERNNKFTYGRDITAGEKTVRATNLDNYVRNRQLDIAEQNGFGNLKEINKDTQGYKYLLDKLIKNENGRLGNNAVTLTDWIVAGEVAANPQAIALLVGKKVASSNWFRKGVVKILNKIGNAKSEADRLVDIAKIQRIQNEKDLTKFLSLPYKKDANIPTYSLNSSNSVKGVVRTITPNGIIKETKPVLPKATIIPKKTIVEKGRATHDPYKTVTMDTKVVSPKVEPVKTVPVVPKPNNNLVEPKVETVLDQKAMDRIESRIYQEVGDFKTVNKYNPTTQSMGNLKTIFERIMKEPGAEQYLKSQGIKSAQSFSDYIHGINRQIRPGINKARSELYKVVDENFSSMKLNAGIEKAGMKGPFEYKDTTQLEKALEEAKTKKTIVPVKQKVTQSTIAQKKQSVLQKPQEKQAVLEGKKQSFDEYFNSLSDEQLIELKGDASRGILGRGKIREIWSKENPKTPIVLKKNITEKTKTLEKKSDTLDTLNPTGGLNVKYDPASRANMKLGKNITTLDKTMGVAPEKEITIYRGTVNNQNDIVPGDFITTNYDLAKSYAGEGKVISKKVKASEILDDVTEPLGDEYIYRPQKSPVPTPKAPVSTTPEVSYTKSPEGKRLADGKPIKEDSNTYRMLDRAEQRKLDAKKAKVEPVSKVTMTADDVAGKFTPRTYNGKGEVSMDEKLKVIKNISESRESKKLPLDKLSFDIQGLGFIDKKTSISNIKGILEDIAKGKPIDPIIINKKGEVIDGNHRMIAQYIAGIKNIDTISPLGVDINKFDNLATRTKGLEKSFDMFNGEELRKIREEANKSPGLSNLKNPKKPVQSDTLVSKSDSMSKDLQPLYDEAKKYKTADEFVDNAVKNTDETKGKFLTDDFIGAENKEFSSSMRTELAKETSKKFKNNEPVEITINQYGEINHGDGHHRAYNGFILGEKIPVKIVKSRLKGEELKKYILLRNAGYKKIRNSTYPGSFSDALESKFKEYSTQLRKIREEAQRQ